MFKKIFISCFFITLGLVVLSCGGKEADAKASDYNEIISINESQLSNFIAVLPVILDFSEKYNSSLSEAQRNSPDANEKYFKALKKSSKFTKTVHEQNFKNIDEVLRLYENVVMEYTEIKRNMTNFNSDIQDLRKKIDDSKLVNKAYLTNKSFSDEQKTEVEKAMQDDEYRYSNILLVKKYELMIDQVVRAYQ